MNASYENYNGKNYITYSLGTSESVDSKALIVLTNRKIKGVIMPLIANDEYGSYYWNDITGLIPFEDYMAGLNHPMEALHGMACISDLLFNLGYFGIDIRYIIWNQIFVDPADKSVKVMCLPARLMQSNMASYTEKDIIQMIMNNTIGRSEISYMALINLYNRVNLAGEINCLGFKVLVDEEIGNLSFCKEKRIELKTETENLRSGAGRGNSLSCGNTGTTVLTSDIIPDYMKNNDADKEEKKPSFFERIRMNKLIKKEKRAMKNMDKNREKKVKENSKENSIKRKLSIPVAAFAITLGLSFTGCTTNDNDKVKALNEVEITTQAVNETYSEGNTFAESEYEKETERVEELTTEEIPEEASDIETGVSGETNEGKVQKGGGQGIKIESGSTKSYEEKIEQIVSGETRESEEVVNISPVTEEKR